jgi:integrase
VQGFYQDRLDAGLRASTVHKVHTILHKALARAVAWQMVPRNVTDAVEPPRPAPREMRPQSPAEARKLLDAAQGDRLEALYVLAATTGMRQGELLALKWQDVDLGNATPEHPAPPGHPYTLLGPAVYVARPLTEGVRIVLDALRRSLQLLVLCALLSAWSMGPGLTPLLPPLPQLFHKPNKRFHLLWVGILKPTQLTLPD